MLSHMLLLRIFSLSVWRITAYGAVADISSLQGGVFSGHVSGRLRNRRKRMTQELKFRIDLRNSSPFRATSAIVDHT